MKVALYLRTAHNDELKEDATQHLKESTYLPESGIFLSGPICCCAEKLYIYYQVALIKCPNVHGAVLGAYKEDYAAL